MKKKLCVKIKTRKKNVHMPKLKRIKKGKFKWRNNSDAERKKKNTFLLRVRIEFVLIMIRLHTVQKPFFTYLNDWHVCFVSFRFERCNGFVCILLKLNLQLKLSLEREFSQRKMKIIDSTHWTEVFHAHEPFLFRASDFGNFNLGHFSSHYFCVATCRMGLNYIYEYINHWWFLAQIL